MRAQAGVILGIQNNSIRLYYNILYSMFDLTSKIGCKL